MDNEQNHIQNLTQINALHNLNFPPPLANPMFHQEEAEQFRNNDSNNDVSGQLNQENNNEEHKKRKRATKKESDIRNFKCTQCDKSYLSYPALYTHCKQKHNTNNHSGRKPRKTKKRAK